MEDQRAEEICQRGERNGPGSTSSTAPSSMKYRSFRSGGKDIDRCMRNGDSVRHLAAVYEVDARLARSFSLGRKSQRIVRKANGGRSAANGVERR
jgi:hypothetical protein